MRGLMLGSQLDRILTVVARLTAVPVSRVAAPLPGSQLDRSLTAGVRLTTAPVSRVARGHGISS